MEIKNRLFPYPVLCVDNDDYIGSEFYVENNLARKRTYRYVYTDYRYYSSFGQVKK